VNREPTPRVLTPPSRRATSPHSGEREWKLPQLFRDTAPAARSGLAEQAYERLEEMIVTLELPPGEVVTEGELAQRIESGGPPPGSGPAPCKPAPRYHSSRRGLRVTEINLTDHLGVLETRKVLDALIAASAARRATPEQRERLRLFSVEMKKARSYRGTSSLSRARSEFAGTLPSVAHSARQTRSSAPCPLRRFWYYP